MVCADCGRTRQCAGRGRCSICYWRLRKAGETPRRVSLSERFWANVDRSGECWRWTGRTHRQYGIFTSRDRFLKAHRVAWTLTNGPIPDGLLVLHRCDNPPCVNPAHLWLGTHADNSRDMVAKGRARNRWAAA